MRKSLLAISIAIQISTQIVSTPVSEIDASEISIQSRRELMLEDFKKVKSIKLEEEKKKLEEIEKEKMKQEEQKRLEQEKIEKERLEQEQLEFEQNKQWVTFELSAYCPCSYCCDENTGITASGVYVAEGMCAAPENIPFNSICVIPELGLELNVQDRGGYIVNTYDGLVRLDVYFDSHEEALEFGRKIIEGYIVYP